MLRIVYEDKSPHELPLCSWYMFAIQLANNSFYNYFHCVYLNSETICLRRLNMKTKQEVFVFILKCSAI